MSDRRRGFAPVVLLGLASAGLAAVAGNRAWVTWSAERTGESSLLQRTGDDSATVPLAGALALVLLACWGVVLVTRGGFRRLVAGLGLVVALGMVVTAALGVRSADAGLREDLAELGVREVTTATQAWFWLYLAAAVVGVAVTALAVRWLPAWPEMGTRYDAPGGAPGRAAGGAPDHPETDLELWKALDAGRDPTLTDRGREDP